MKEVEKFIESGIIETYVLGVASANEVKEVQEMSALYPQVNEEIDKVTEALKSLAETNITPPNSTIKPMVLASIDYIERMMRGEKPLDVPILNESSTVSDYSEWLNRKEMVLPEDFNWIHVKLIGATPQASSAIVWIQGETPYETHESEHEKFLIVEGTCDIIIDGKARSLVPGDYLSIPLYAGHVVKVTSSIPCKVILQRVAA